MKKRRNVSLPITQLDLKIIPAEEDAVIIGESLLGEACRTVGKQFFEQMIEDSDLLRIKYMQGVVDRNMSISEDLEDFGTKLFRAIFRDDLLTLYNRTVGAAEGGQIHIRLMLGDPKLNAIQWEVMRHRGEFVGFRHNFVRHPFVVRPLGIKNNDVKPLRVLIVAVDPMGDDSIKGEHENLTALFGRFGDLVDLKALFQKDATLTNLVDAFFAGVDIFHFTGHGAFNEDDPAGSFLVLNGSKQAFQRGNPEGFDRLTVRMMETLVASQPIRFCFLNGCSTARTDISNEYKTGKRFVNMAHSLVERGVPIVVATNHEISVNAAVTLSRRFYRSAVQLGKRVDQAVRDGRSELFLGIERYFPSDWSCPVLYARSDYMYLGLENLRVPLEGVMENFPPAEFGR
jgi:CHAT domain